MLPDGRINPGNMTSFNHYALGSVANFLYSKLAGLSPLEPGWKRALVKPQPGGTITSAETTFDSPYGPYSVSWTLNGEKLVVHVSVPPNTEAKVELPGVEKMIGSGKHVFEAVWPLNKDWPPAIYQGPQSAKFPDSYVP
jgi:alpha-L-rhamnosidase